MIETQITICMKHLINVAHHIFHFCALLLIAPLTVNAYQPGAVDPTCNPGSGIDDSVRTLAVQPDGKMVIGGYFATVRGAFRFHIARLNTDGTVDASFDPGTGFDYRASVSGVVECVKLQSDGKVLIGGSFNTFNGLNRPDLVRLNPNGTYDATFNPAVLKLNVYDILVQSDGKIVTGSLGGMVRYTSTGANDATFSVTLDDSVNSIVLQSDGKYVISGSFSTVNGVARSGIARLNSNGTLDSTFVPGSGLGGGVVKLQSDGKILVAGYFGTLYGKPQAGLFRLNPDGSVDTTFAPSISVPYPGDPASVIVRTIALQTNGSIIIGGHFTYINGTNRNNIARLMPDGNVDPTFDPGKGFVGGGDDVLDMSLQANGQIVAGGFFTSFNDVSRLHLARVNSDGSLDSTLVPTDGIDGRVNDFQLQPDGKMIVGGDFTEIQGTARNCLARLNADGSLDNTYDIGSGAEKVGDLPRVATVAVQLDGKSLVGGSFSTFGSLPRNNIVRLNSDGSVDQTFLNAMNGATDPFTINPVYINRIALQADGKALVSGSFKRFNETDRNGFVRLNFDGSVDTSFDVGNALSQCDAIIPQADGKILIGGSSIKRLNSDGTVDGTFSMPSGFSGKLAAQQSDGKLIVLGNIAGFNLTNNFYVFRLNPDGSLDNSFSYGTGCDGNFYLSGALVQPDGKIIVSGCGKKLNGGAAEVLGRLNADGAFDNTFNAGLNLAGSGGASTIIETMKLQPDGDLLVSGLLSLINGVPRSSIARLFAASTGRFMNPHLESGIFKVNFDGPAGQVSVIERSVDLTHWSPFQTNILGTNALTVADSSSTNSQSGFYRARLQP
jgi:uncharacterized delta-60 repeat protein